MVLAGLLLAVRARSGDVVIELSDPSAKVDVAVDGKRVDGTGPDRPLRLRAGEHGLTVTGDGFEPVATRFTATSGEREVVRISLRRPGGPAAKGGPGKPAEADPAAALAGWLLAAGIQVQVQRDNGPTWVKGGSGVPPAPFAVTGIDSAYNRALDVKRLAASAAARTVRHLNIWATPFGDADLAALPDMPDLEFLNVGYTGVTSASVARLARFPKLDELYLIHLPVEGRALAGLAALPRLRHLSLRNAALDDPGIAALPDLPELKVLDIGATRVTDAGLSRLPPNLTTLVIDELALTDGAVPHLVRLKRLRSLRIDQGAFSAAGLQRLREGLPKCGLEIRAAESPAPKDPLSRDQLLAKVAALERRLAASGGRFDFVTHNELRHCFFALGDARKEAEQVEVILRNAVMDPYLVGLMKNKTLPPGSPPRTDAQQVDRLRSMAADARDRPCTRATLGLCIVDFLAGDPTAVRGELEAVLRVRGEGIEPYHKIARDRLAQLGPAK